MSSTDTANTGQDPGETEPHQLDEETFYGKVRSFSFWFEAVEGATPMPPAQDCGRPPPAPGDHYTTVFSQ